MATRKKPYDKTTEGKDAGDFPRAYVRLRTVLDGLEISAIRYSLKDKNVARRLKRIEEIEGMVMPIIRALQERTIAAPGGGGSGCGEGYFNCGGVCVPYQCPEGK